MEPLFFIIVALLLGTLTRHLLKKFPVPYTVLLVIIGLLIGALVRFNVVPEFMHTFSKSVEWAGNIDPHIVLFVFLPTLIFEAAFSMDWHTFRKTSVNATLLAAPGIVIALVLTGVLLMGLKFAGVGLADWTWQIALMFGAVISATDPVAVVAILKELGASKRLSTLIDGESILNDGTAIVLFMVFYLPLSGADSGMNPIVNFLWVAAGGLILGIIISRVVMFWLKRVFNDSMVEIIVILAAAYLTFFIAEDFLHVSGVLALFGLGISMASTGKTKISPEVQKFLSEFWELAVYICNTLIFIIVGVVIAVKVKFTVSDIIVLVILYAGIHIVRAIMIAILYPLMKKSGYGINFKDSIVAWYGALRGAVGLALALIVSSLEVLPVEVRDQFLFLTAGIVVLTLLINATTVKIVVDKLGLTKISESKASIVNAAYREIYDTSKKNYSELSDDRFFRHADLKKIETFLPSHEYIESDVNTGDSAISELRRRVLEKEKAKYWEIYNNGIINSDSVVKLTEAVSELLDSDGNLPLHERNDLEHMLKNKKFVSVFKNVPLLRKVYSKTNYQSLSMSYYFGLAFIEAQTANIEMLDSLKETLKARDSEFNDIEIIHEEVSQNLIHGLTFIRNFKKLYPEIYIEIVTRQAAQIMLNKEKNKVEELLEAGTLENSEAQRLVEDVEARMKKLQKGI